MASTPSSAHGATAPAPALSVVSVVRNDLKRLQRTCAALEPLLGPRIEHVIVDGASSDGTAEWLSARPVPGRRYVAQQSRGLWQAMNEGAAVVRAPWVLFLNAGDVPAGPQSLERLLAAAQSHPEAAAIYGDVIVQDGDRRLELPAAGLDVLWARIPCCHQSVLHRVEVLRGQPFDPGWRLIADHVWLADQHRSGASLIHVPGPVSVVETGGVVDNHPWAFLRERMRQGRRWPQGRWAYLYWAKQAFWTALSRLRRRFR